MKTIQGTFLEDGVQEENMARVLVSTTYSADSIILSITRLSPDRIYLLIDKKPGDVQKQTIEHIKSTFSSAIEVKEKKVELYDMVSVSKTVTDMLDTISSKDEVYVNITPGRKTQAIGVLFGCYTRPTCVKKIFYVPEGTKEMITLPILSFDISDTQKEILDNIEKIDTPKALAGEIESSRAMLYRNIKNLLDRGFIEAKDKEGFRLTEAGRVARL